IQSSSFLRNGFGLRQPGDPITRYSEYRPFIHRCRTKLAIKLDRRVIPLEDSPFHPPATAIAGHLGKIDKQRAAITFAALLRFHEQIFEIKSGSPKPGGEIVKEDCEPDRGFSFKREKNFCNGFFAK